LAIELGCSSKKAKDRVTLVLTTNGDRSYKLDPWLIGKFKNYDVLRILIAKLLESIIVIIRQSG
jgi:hypothetical protein